MKLFLVGFSLFVSAMTTVKANEMSEFERGYQAGLSSCSPQTAAYLCYGPFIDFDKNSAAAKSYDQLAVELLNNLNHKKH